MATIFIAMKKTRIVILAAGLGKRMGGKVPKALTPVGGKPILQHLVESIKESGVDQTPIVVVGKERQKFCESFGAICEYTVQEEQLGTAHAAATAEETCGDAETIVVLYGDHPFISSETIKKLVMTHEASEGVLTMMTTRVPGFEGWHKAFKHWGRIIRSKDGTLEAIRQYKDANEEEQGILEVDPATFCFDAKWLWKNVMEVGNQNSQDEYYLTDLVSKAFAEGYKVETVEIPPEEAVGINKPEELQIAEEILEKKAKMR